MSTSAEIGRSPIALSRCCSQAGLGPLRTPRITRPTNSGQALPSPSGKSSAIATPAPAVARDWREVAAAQPAQAGGGEIARDAGDAEAVAAVGGELDLDHRPLEAQHPGRGQADLGLRRQLDDAAMVVAELQLARRAQHADAGHAADHRLLQHLARGRDHRAFGREDRLDAGAGVGRAADDLEHAVPRLDGAQAQPIGVRVLLGLADIADAERGQLGARIGHALDLEAQHGEPLAERVERRVGLEMLLEPWQGELHRDSPP